MLRPGPALALALAALFVASPAAAQDSCTCDPASEDPVALFDAGATCFREGQFDVALQCFEAAYALDPNPTLTYNIARAHESNDDPQPALDAYERYLEEKPEAPDRGAVEKRIQALRDELARREALRAPPVAPQPETMPQPEPAGPSWIPWAVTGVGAVGVGLGVAFLVISSGQEQDAIDEPDAFTALDRVDQAEQSRTIGAVSTIAGGVLMAAGLTWGLIDVSTSSDSALGMGPGGMWWRARF